MNKRKLPPKGKGQGYWLLLKQILNKQVKKVLKK